MKRQIDKMLLHDIWAAKVPRVATYTGPAGAVIEKVVDDNLQAIYDILEKSENFDVYCEHVFIHRFFGNDEGDQRKDEYGIVFIGLTKRFKTTRNIEVYPKTAIGLHQHYCDWKFLTGKQVEKIFKESDGTE